MACSTSPSLEVLSPGHAPATAGAACAGAASAAMAVWCGARILPLERRVYSITLVVGYFYLFGTKSEKI